jgi:hypothetical protein
VGARRPTVTIALAELEAEGSIRRLPTRAVVLALESWNRLADGPCPIGGPLAA